MRPSHSSTKAHRKNGLTRSGATALCANRSASNSVRLPTAQFHTLLLGEKYLNPDRYETGNDLCDNEALTIGWNYDSTRFTILDIPPMQDRRGFDYEWDAFGSAHAAVFYVAYCDASVHPMSYNVDPVVFSRLGGRNEGQMASPEE